MEWNGVEQNRLENRIKTDEEKKALLMNLRQSPKAAIEEEGIHEN